VVQASEKVVPILVDCTRQGSHQTYLNTYKIRGFPTLLFVGPDGESLGGVDQRDAATLIQQIDRFSKPPGRSSLPALAFLFVFAVAVVGGLVFAYKKWFATTAEE
jgi:hypothetical protein